MPIFVVQNSLVMYTCACAAVGPPYIIICFIHMYRIINYFLLFILVRFILLQTLFIVIHCIISGPHKCTHTGAYGFEGVGMF